MRVPIIICSILLLLPELRSQFPCTTGCGATTGVAGINLLEVSTSFGGAVGAPTSCQTALISPAGDTLEVEVQGPGGAPVCLLASLGCDPAGCFTVEAGTYCVNVGDSTNTWGPLPGFCFTISVPSTGPAVWSSGAIPIASGLPPGRFLCLQGAILDPGMFGSNPLNMGTTQAVCLEASAWCPNGAQLSPGSEGSVLVQGISFPFYGTTYTECYVGANGFITFGSGSNDPTPTVAELLDDQPRIAALWADLDPTMAPGFDAGVKALSQPGGGMCIAWDRVARQLAMPGGGETPQTVCAELPTDGSLQIVFGPVGLSALPATPLIVGISPGLMRSNASALDLSALPAPFPFPVSGTEAIYEDFGATGPFDLELRTLVFEPFNAQGQFAGYQVTVN